MTGQSSLLDNIAKLEALLQALKDTARDNHALLKDIRDERREVERLFKGKDVQQMVHDKTSEIVKTELDKIGPEVRAQTNLIYDKVGREMDRLIDLALGKEFAHQYGREDMRPLLAVKLREWLDEIVEGA